MKKRLISASIMAAILIPLILIGGIAFRIGVGIIGILAYKEFLDLKGMDKYPKLVVAIGLAVMLTLIFSNRDIVFAGIGLDYKYLAFVFLATLCPSIIYFDKKNYTTREAFELMGFVLFLGITLNLISNILIYEKKYFFLIVILTILTDTFAFLTGSVIGKHKFTKISPNKSIEGCIGGILMGSILTAIYYVTFIGTSPLWKVVPVLIILSIICEVGDLFYSAIKREWNKKDFSNLIPGHGGVLDRVDSLTFVTIAYVLLKGLL